MIIEIDEEIKLVQLKDKDTMDIFNTIDSQRDYLGQWLAFVASTKELSDTENFVKSIILAEEDQFEYVFTIRKANEFVGLIGFTNTDRNNQKTEIGYWLSEDYQRQGIMKKAVSYLCNFGFNTLKMNRIQIRCALGNLRSQNIPKKLGFTLEGVERQGELMSSGIYTDIQVYSKLKSDL